MKQGKFLLLICGLLLGLQQATLAQEVVAPLKSNIYLQSATTSTASKKTRLILPFIDDFSYQGPYPDATLWEDQQVFINNTMSENPITKGVATFDGLNAKGRPYFSSFYGSGYCDSLTSKPINLQANATSDKIYLSFYVQPQGLGFAPETNDSLFLFFRDSSNHWVKVWQARGTGWTALKIQLVPVMDMKYMHDSFQFRFVNIASMNTNDDIWNIDYVKMDVNRSPSDSILNDVAFTQQPMSILSPYSSLPYRHFTINQGNEKSSNQNLSLFNQYNLAQNIVTHHEAMEVSSSAQQSSSLLPSQSIGARQLLTQNVPSYSINYTAPSPYSKVVIRNSYYFDAVNAQDRRSNDTITSEAIFDNYFAYDDGTAEKAYFLLPAFNSPSKTALQFHLNEPDTVRGLMTFFAPQLPSAVGKYFSIVLYQSLGSLTMPDSIIHQEDLFQVKYDTLINGFTTYAFETPVALNAGTYYMGITQPANFGSDSIYYGLDMNRQTNSQFLYYNVDGYWFASSANGSIMMRPMVGAFFTPSSVGSVSKKSSSLVVYPNPAQSVLNVASNETWNHYRIYSVLGNLMQEGIPIRQAIQISSLAPGMYMLECRNKNNQLFTTQFVKQ
ncbi:MAG TPA: T9SS type A sorting domain-containing protein [Chitinophagaceae bacterium]|nr:T9SS type A sorting domain-containing protein [Chitinophagaceae bacterium]